MVSIGVSKLGQTQLIFVDPAVKINGAYYRDVLLTQQLLPVVHEISGDFILQQDSAQAQHPRSLHQTCGPNSPDLNPVDYKILGEMHQRVYQTAVKEFSKSVNIFQSHS